MNKKYFDSRKGSVEATINTIRSEQKTIVKEEPKVSLQPKSYFGQKKDSLADVAAKVVSESNEELQEVKYTIGYEIDSDDPIDDKYTGDDEMSVNASSSRDAAKKFGQEMNKLVKKAGQRSKAILKIFITSFEDNNRAYNESEINKLDDYANDFIYKRIKEDTNIYIGNDKKEDTDIDSVNDVALKNAEKSKSKDKDTKESKALTKEEQDHIKKEFGIKYEALSPEKQKQMDQLMKDFLARGGKIKKLKPGIAKGAGHLDKRGPYKADMLKGSKKHLAAQKDNSDELAGGKTATGQKVSKVDTRPNIREV